MLGRATRQCPDIGKETFRIFDAVDLYPHLQNLTEMRPVVVNPQISLEQLFEELAAIEAEEHRKAVLDQIVVKLRRRLSKLHDEARQRYEATTGETPEATLERLRKSSPGDAAAWVKSRPSGFAKILDWDPEGQGGAFMPISHHDDKVVAVTRGYGAADKPEDFLDGFTSYVRNNVNKIAALDRRRAAPPRADPRPAPRRCGWSSTSSAIPRPICAGPGRTRRTRTSPPRSSALCGRPRSATPLCRSRSACARR